MSDAYNKSMSYDYTFTNDPATWLRMKCPQCGGSKCVTIFLRNIHEVFCCGICDGGGTIMSDPRKFKVTP